MSAEFSYFRTMNEADLAWVQSVEKVSYPFPWSSQGFMKVLDDGLGYVLCDAEQRSLGYACFLSVLDEIHLLNFCVAPAFRCNNVASQALQKFKIHFAEAGFAVMLLEVRASNPARKLYQRMGFAEDGMRKGYYPLKDCVEKEDAILMSWRLSAA